MSGEPDPSGEQRELVARLRAVIEARDAELAALRAGLAAALADLDGAGVAAAAGSAGR